MIAGPVARAPRAIRIGSCSGFWGAMATINPATEKEIAQVADGGAAAWADCAWCRR